MRITKSAEERRSELIQTALKLFSSKGYEATTVEDITGAIQIAKGSFYLHFQSKQEVFKACIEHLVSNLLEAFLLRLSDKTKTPAERLSSYIEYNFSLAEANQDGALYRMLHAPAFAAEHDRILSGSIRKLTPEFVSLIEEGRTACGFQPTDAAVSAAALLGTLHYVHDALATRDDLSVAQKRELVFDLIARILGADIRA